MLRFSGDTLFPVRRYPAGKAPENCTSTGTFLAASRVKRSRSCDGTARRNVTPGGKLRFDSEMVKVRSSVVLTFARSNSTTVSAKLAAVKRPAVPRNSRCTFSGEFPVTIQPVVRLR